jgi:hypothetical protein
VRKGALKLFANFSDHEISITEGHNGRLLYGFRCKEFKDNKLPAFSAVWLLQG